MANRSVSSCNELNGFAEENQVGFLRLNGFEVVPVFKRAQNFQNRRGMKGADQIFWMSLLVIRNDLMLLSIAYT